MEIEDFFTASFKIRSCKTSVQG